MVQSNWFETKRFLPKPNKPDSVKNYYSPSLRFTMVNSMTRANPFDYIAEYQDLFEKFIPILRRDATKLYFFENGSFSPRKRKSIKETDWEPYSHHKKTRPPGACYGGRFHFVSGNVTFDRDKFPWSQDVDDRGPTRFVGTVLNTVNVDASIPIDDFLLGNIDVNGIVSAAMKIPFSSFSLGYGLSYSVGMEEDVSEDQLKKIQRIARRYPVLDISPAATKSWSSEFENRNNKSWIGGINWITGVGEPFLDRLGGAQKVMENLAEDISAKRNENGVAFTIGDKPITGEHTVDDKYMPQYFELGRRLRPIADGHPSSEHPRVSVFPSQAVSINWERRFYDKKWFDT